MAHPYALTVDGYETQFGTNHLGHFLFTALIFPRLVAASTPEFPSRVVNVSSGGHHYSDVRLDDYNFSEGKEYGDLLGYGQSKTANILFAIEISKRAKERGLNVLAYSLHPGGKLVELPSTHRGILTSSVLSHPHVSRCPSQSRVSHRKGMAHTKRRDDIPVEDLGPRCFHVRNLFGRSDAVQLTPCAL